MEACANYITATECNNRQKIPYDETPSSAPTFPCLRRRFIEFLSIHLFSSVSQIY